MIHNQYICRVCGHLVYESQREQPFFRALRKAQSIRLTLGGSPNMTLPFPPKPKRMRRRTYELYMCQYDMALGEYVAGVRAHLR